MLRDHANKNLIPNHNEEVEEDWAEPGDDAKILSKYDDVGEVAKQKKKSKWLQVGQEKVSTSNDKATEDSSHSTSFKKKMGSDYYATNEEDPLVGSNSFKKKSKIG